MKIAIASLFAASVAARKLDQNGYDYNQAQEYDETSFLKNYEQVFMKCIPDTQVINQEGEYEYNAVVYRMCPSGNACSDKGKVCDEGYGDYVVGLQQYVRQFFEQFDEDQNNNGQQDDGEGYDFGDLGECRELDIEKGDDDNAPQYFIGPACTEDGDVKLDIFLSEYCRPGTEAGVTLEELMGVELPYSEGGLMDDDECKAYYCWAANDNGEYELNKFCEELYMNSAMKCEENMEYTSDVNGMSVSGCEAIAEMIPAPKGGSGVWLVIILVALVAGGAVYFVMQKKKAASSEGLMM